MFNEYSPITRLTIADLLTENTAYTIPIYQRSYAWETPEIEQLIQDVIDYAQSSPDKNYYIGTLVVSADQRISPSSFITIDGQQRLTTLFILHAVLQHDHQSSYERLLRLKFECRPLADQSLAAIADNNLPTDASDYEANILAAYKICQQALRNKLSSNDITGFMHYLYEQVVIFRVGLRAGTDLNHYFEVMNSRGAQLEKHEVLKARLMSVFNNDAHGARYRTCFDRIWVACSNMDRYVQHGFFKEHRHHLFGYQDWSKLTVDSFDDLVSKIHPEEGTIKAATLSLSAILEDNKTAVSAEQVEDSSERFHSTINFPNFLLHVLQLEVPTGNIPLDDNRLLDTFINHTPKEESATINFVKSFIFHLLKYRLLFDKYIIKREFNTDGDRWSLKCLRWYSPKGQQEAVRYVNTFENEVGDIAYSDNRRILMLLSMFHVSSPSPSYKHWLYAALRYLSQQQEIHAHAYIAYLENVARDHVIARVATPLAPEQLRFGTIGGPFVFNFLDYLLWKSYEGTDNRVRYFEYTFRHSTEHYYPQHPVDPAKEIDEAHLHAFGNLCLITHEKNSLLNNKLPNEKKAYYPADNPIDSIKQYLMMQYKDWHIAEIQQHGKEMIALLTAHM